ncbi:SDR family oxidoreductase [Marinobacter sp. TBZ242]|uniref:SDR family oxidoreductase n=1 Tax=Marinobacter azerbaijanicus TaxID=3050455 RepID=A0ABT7I8K2_9GAMM|nr:SDR family oxidoreductase [Marinobacter sp. TBZ242]MDL0430122.1 SDR family oxidoreductase [Marinobacter sp. TBZ242]
MKLQDSVIAITGGGQGLGRAMGEYLAARGARVALIDLMPETLDEAAEACRKAGGEARTYVCNVAKEEDVEKTFESIVADFGHLNGLINNAGILRDGLLVKVKDGQVEKRMELSQWQAVIDVNLTGVFLCGREAATQMIRTGDEGVIINIASIARAGNMGQSNYSAAKAGVSALVPVWAKELARYGIRCMGIAPGFIETAMTASMKPEALEKMTAGIPLKRMGKPEEIASAAAFIFENDYMSGRMLEVDGALRL